MIETLSNINLQEIATQARKNIDAIRENPALLQTVIAGTPDFRRKAKILKTTEEETEREPLTNSTSKPIVPGVLYKSKSESSLANFVTETTVDITAILENQLSSTDDTFITTVVYAAFQIWLLLAATILYGLYGVFIRLSKKGHDFTPYNAAVIFIHAEALKLVVSILLLIKEEGLSGTIKEFRKLSLKFLVIQLLPAFFYCGTNNLDVALLTYMDPGSLQVLMQTKVLPTSLLWRYVFKKTLSRDQWLALLILMVGSACIAWPREEPSNRVMYVLPFGIILLTIQIFMSASAGIYCEWHYKKGSCKDISVHVQNVILYAWGILANYLLFRRTQEAPMFDQFNTYAILLVLIYMCKGLAVSQIMKHFSNIVKLLVNGAAMFISFFCTWYIFGLSLTWIHIIGLLAMACSMWLYNKSSRNGKAKNSERTSAKLLTKPDSPTNSFMGPAKAGKQTSV